ncbi:MAG: ABC-type Mn/Zn transport system permease component [Candidatus Phytoplasma cynodontis]|uniref:metal ABC transporter permease n=1 Tax='Cynodon dactylon' phytoplasma TaxID=295320 RepID=UPI001265B10E|nr:metal ABC transporter permease ['Cynodon dactylon' phytoplasma]KAB8121823.1 metal ABC transporter permease ['Cynodon dactylon' phytoplasma]WIA07710.1 MAG: ABC-type Mn/Zn transport system permease component [Candidatus Phytoplasma cynodontis]
MNLFNYTFLKVLLGIYFLGCGASLLGIFIILKKQSLVGDAVSHTVLPGIALIYIWVKDTNEFVLWIGSILGAFVSLFIMEIIKKYSKIKIDTILSLVLSSFFGLGNVLICFIQNRMPDNKIAVLEKFILGQSALISFKSVVYTGIITIIILISVLLLWKEFKIFIFDELFAKSIGFRTNIISFILNILLISIVVSSLKLIGIILTSAFLIIPGIIARQFSDHLNVNIYISIFITLLTSFIGAIISNEIKHMPTGPIIIVIMFLFFLFSIILAPKYGILKNYLIKRKYQKEIIKFKRLIYFYHKNQNFNIQKKDLFLFEQKYLIFSKNKILITKKGLKIIEKLINGDV